MEKVKISLCDLSFYGDKSSSKYHESKYIEWDRSGKLNNITVFTDLCFKMSRLKQFKNTKKICLLLEPPSISPQNYEYIEKNYADFDIVISHWTDFLYKIPNGIFSPCWQSWIDKKHFGICNKTKNISTITSWKQWTELQKFRHKLLPLIKEKIDIFGNGTDKPIDHKVQAIQDYRFHLVIENCSLASYWSEKFTDAILLKSVPIYLGCPTIKNFYNPEGILFIDESRPIDSVLNLINYIATEEFYNDPDVQNAVKENFDIAKNQIVQEDYIYENILKELI